MRSPEGVIMDIYPRQQVHSYDESAGYIDLDFRVVRYGWVTILCWQRYLPNTEVISLHWRCFAIPFIYVMLISTFPHHVRYVALTEITNEVGLCGIRSPFPVCDVPVLIDIEPEFLVALKDY